MKGKNTPEKTKNVEKAREEQKMGEKTIEKNAITEGVIWKQLLIFFFPIMLGTLIQQLYTTVDTIIVGRFVGKAALASVGGPAAVLSTIVVTFFNGLANGAAVIIAQYYGAKDRKSLHVGLHTAYLFSIVISLIVSLVGTVLTPWLLTIMNTPQDMMADSTIYLRIYFMGILFTLVYNMGAAIMRAVGDSRRPLLYLLVCCVMNIILDIVMVVGMKMGIAGAALATVISQCVSAILVTWSLTRAYDAMKLKFRELRMDARVLKKELKIGVPGALQACAYGVTNVVIQASVNSFGTDTAAGWAAYGKLDLIFWTVSSALGAAVTTFAGQNYGAGKMDRVYKSIRVNVVISYIFTGAIIVILFVFCEPLYHMFTTDPKVIEIGVYMLRFLIPSYLLSVLLENLSGGLRGLGDVFWPTVFTFGGLFFVRLPWIMILTKIHHEGEVLLISYPLAWGGTLLCLIPYYFWRKKKRMKLAGR